MKLYVLGMSLLFVVGVAAPTPPAFAMMISGAKCAGMVSMQKNPQTGEVTRSCRTVDGGIATETVKSGKTRKPRPKPVE
jgi:hypothetical protein